MGEEEEWYCGQGEAEEVWGEESSAVKGVCCSSGTVVSGSSAMQGLASLDNNSLGRQWPTECRALGLR